MSPIPAIQSWVRPDLTRQLRVRDVMSRKSIDALPLCRKSDSFPQVVKALAGSTGVRNVYVIDEHERLLGQISLSWLSRVLLFDYQPTTFLPRLMPIIIAKCADDVMEPSDLAVQEDNSLEEVLRSLVPTREEECPVINDQGRLVGCLTVVGVLERLVSNDE